MKIRRLQLKNIGVFDDETIEFKPCPVKDKAEIHIFTGQNGSGKSTLLATLASLFEVTIKPARPEGMNLSFLYIEALNNSFYKRLRKDGSINFNLRFRGKNYSFSFVKAAGFSTNPVDSVEKGLVTPTVFFEDDDFERLLAFYSLAVKADRMPLIFNFAVFAFSGYRLLKSEGVEAIYEPKDFNPLNQSLEFIKDYSNPKQLTVNQLVANNFSKKWIESSRNQKKSEKFAQVLATIEQAIFEITSWQIKFDLQTEPINLIANVNGEDLDFDVLPDGLRSLISWIADLLGRIDLLQWQDDLPINEKSLILFLDEIEVHLHPAWQRKVLPVVQKLFKNSQIFVSTHSPFVVNSVDDAWVYKLELENGKARVAEVVLSEDGYSYSHVLSEIFDIKEEFGIEVQKDLDKFKELRNQILASKNGAKKTEQELLKLAKDLAVQSEELQTIVQFELRQINKRTGKNLTL